MLTPPSYHLDEHAKDLGPFVNVELASSQQGYLTKRHR